MKPEDVPEEHRKYLDMKDNPKRVSNTSIFALLSSFETKVSERLGIIETKQEACRESLDKLETKLEKSIEVTDAKIESLEDDFKQCSMSGMGTRGRNEERFSWLNRWMKFIAAGVLGTLGLLLWHLGLPFFLP